MPDKADQPLRVRVDPDDVNIRLEAAYRSFDRMLTWGNNADSKSLIFLTFDAILAGAITSNAQAIAGDLAVRRGFLWQWLIVLLALGFASGFVLSVLSVLLALFPQSREREHEKNSLFFFGTVARMPAQEFMKQSAALTPTDIEQQILSQVHVNAEIITRKFWHLQRAVRLLIIASSFLMLAVLLGLLTAR